MRMPPRWRMPSRWVAQVALAVVTGLLAILTLVWPEWIEEIFGIEPDGGNGALEILIVIGLFIVTLALSGLGFRSRRRFLAQSA